MLSSLICVLISLFVICNCDQCIRYEFHETAINQEGNAELLINDCRSKNSKVTDYNVHLLQIYGPPMINITFNCCSGAGCRNDLQCPFNFNCNRNKCLVADCNLRDEMEIVEVENEECIIDEDCYFKIPLDKKHWSCLSETAECTHKDTCLKKCKRCGFAGDHWSNFANNSIDTSIGLYNNNESPSTSVLNDVLPARNTSTPSSLVEFNLNSLINNEPESDSPNELRSEEGFSRLLDNNARNNPSSSNNRTSNRLNLNVENNNEDLFSSIINSTTIPNRFVNSNNITSILEFIHNNPINRLNNNNATTFRSNTSRSSSRSTTLKPLSASRRPDDDRSSGFGFTRNDLPTNIINELTRSSLEPSSTTSRTPTTTTTTTTSTTTTTTSTPATPISISSSSEESSSAELNNSNEISRFNSTIDDFLFTREIRRDENAENVTRSTNRLLDNNSLINLFSSLISSNANSSSSANTSSSPIVNSYSVPLINSSNIRTNDPFNSPLVNSLFGDSTTTFNTATTTTSQPTVNAASSTSASTNAVLSASSILNRSRSAARNNDNNSRFAARRSTSLRSSNSGRSLLNNHRLIHIPNNDNRLSNGNNRASNRRIVSTTTTTSTTIRPPSLNSNNPYYLTSVLANHNAFNEMLPGILYAMEADIDIPRLNSTPVH